MGEQLHGKQWYALGDIRYVQENPSGITYAASLWRHQMETFPVLLAIWEGNSPVTGEFPAQKSVTWSFDVFFYLRLTKRLSKQWWDWWFKTPSYPLWRHRNMLQTCNLYYTCYLTIHQIYIDVFHTEFGPSSQGSSKHKNAIWIVWGFPWLR